MSSKSKPTIEDNFDKSKPDYHTSAVDTINQISADPIVRARLAFSLCLKRVDNVLFTIEDTAVSDKGNITAQGYYDPDVHGDIISNLILVFNVPFVVTRVKVSLTAEYDGWYPYKVLLMLRKDGWYL